MLEIFWKPKSGAYFRVPKSSSRTETLGMHGIDALLGHIPSWKLSDLGPSIDVPKSGHVIDLFFDWSNITNEMAEGISLRNLPYTVKF